MAGRADEFVALLSPHRDALYRFARHMCWDRNRADDVLQDALLAAFHRFDQFEPGTNFKAWIFRFLANTLLNENRKYRKEPDTVDAAEVGDAAPAAADSAYESVLADADREGFLEQLSDPLKRALEGLSEAERTVFLLRIVEDFSYKEISELLDIPPGTAMSHLHRGRAKLRERLADYARTHGYDADGDPAEAGADSETVRRRGRKRGTPPAAGEPLPVPQE